jgi:MFS-type transporter involved in bile tolerance (Atg22 family)
VSFRALNAIHIPVALVSIFLLPIIMLTRRSEYSDLRLLAATVAIALLANAVVCGTLSNPHDRYGARLVWIATFAIALVAIRFVMTGRSQASVAVAG